MHQPQQATLEALTVQEVATALRVSPRHVNRLISDRRIASVSIGRARRVRIDALRDYLRAHETIAR